MATALWRCLFADSPLLQRLKDVKAYKNAVESKNIVAINELSVFVWNANEQNILTVGLKCLDTANEKEFQVLLLSNPPSFDVDIFQFNHSNTLLVAHGKHGVSVIELPRRWGKDCSFEGGQERVLCKSWGIASRFFACNTRIRISQVLWHPGSSSNCHICILSSDNYLRVYDVTDPQTPFNVYNLGEQSANYYLTSASSMSFAASLGEVSVSFDFGPSKVVPNTNNVTWPIFILKGNGDVFVVNSTFKKVRAQTQHLLGPLKMYPPAEDNYGVDACSIICLKSTPPVLVIATCSGVIHHCIVLGTTESETDVSWKIQEREIKEFSADISLYVYESLELSLFMAQGEIGGDNAFSCPLRLHKDLTGNFRYHCTHVAGLHAIAMPIIQQLDKFSETDNTNTVMPILQEQDSVVEHLICTRPFPSSPNAPVLGLIVASTPLGATLICLLSSWEFICLPLISACQMLTTNHQNNEDDGQSVVPLASLGGGDFVQTLMNVLQCSTHTPLVRALKTEGDAEPSSQQCLELLGNVIQRLREEYVHRLEVAEGQVERRVKILTEQKKQLNSDLERCLRSREQLRNCAEKIAEKYEEIDLKQQKLHRRVEELLENLQRRLPILADEEIDMQKELQTITEKLKNLENSFQQIKLKFSFQQEQIKGTLWAEQSLENRRACYETSLDSIQTRQLKDLLSKEGNSISELVVKINWLKKQMNL